MVREQIIGALDLDMLLAYSDDPLAAGAVRYLTDFDVYAMYAIVVLPSRGTFRSRSDCIIRPIWFA